MKCVQEHSVRDLVGRARAGCVWHRAVVACSEAVLACAQHQASSQAQVSALRGHTPRQPRVRMCGWVYRVLRLIAGVLHEKETSCCGSDIVSCVAKRAEGAPLEFHLIDMMAPL